MALFFDLLGCLLKKYLSFVLLFFLAAPAAHAYDFGTSGTVAALGAAGAGLALTFGAPAALGTVAIGALVAGIQFATDPAANQSGQVEVQLSPSAKLAAPPGWSQSTTSDVEPVPPSTAASVTNWYDSGGTRFDSQELLCSSKSGTYGTATPYGQTCCQYNNSGACNIGGITHSTGCSAGYSLVSGVCTLSNASQVPKPSDNKCTIKRTGNSFAVDPRDPDCASGKIPATTSISPSVITSTKSDGSSKSVTINQDGTATVGETRPNNSTNTTESNTTTMSAPDASAVVKVTGQGSGVAPGTGTQAGTAAPAVNVNFDKSGLATEGTQNAIKTNTDAIKTNTDAIKNSLDATGLDNSLSSQKTAFDNAFDSFTGLFGAESGRASGISNDFSFSGFLPAQCGCTPLSINFHGHSASFDWCAPMDTFKSVLAWAFGMLTALFVLSQFRVGGSK